MSTTIAPGSSSTITLAAGSQITGTGTGNVQKTGVSVDVVTPWTVGPYTTAQSITLSATSTALVYDLVQGVVSGAGNSGPTAKDRAALARWYAALANSDIAQAIAVLFGDSVVEGANSTAYTKRWVARLQNALRRQRTNVAGGVGFLTPYFRTTTMGQPYIATTGAPTNTGYYGFGTKSTILSAGQSRTYTFFCTSFNIHYAKETGNGTLSYTIDGGSAVNITTGDANNGTAKSASGALTDGSHTVVVSNGGGGDVRFKGFDVFRGDETSGVRVYEHGYFGTTAVSRAGSGDPWDNEIDAIGAHLVGIALGLNDYQSQTAVATFKAAIKTIISRIRNRFTASTQPSILLIAMHQRGDVSSPTIPWQSYVQAMRECAAEDTNNAGGTSGVAFLDLSGVLPSPTATAGSDPLGLFANDYVHPLDPGHGVIGENAARYLLS